VLLLAFLLPPPPPFAGVSNQGVSFGTVFVFALRSPRLTMPEPQIAFMKVGPWFLNALQKKNSLALPPRAQTLQLWSCSVVGCDPHIVSSSICCCVETPSPPLPSPPPRPPHLSPRPPRCVKTVVRIPILQTGTVTPQLLLATLVVSSNVVAGDVAAEAEEATAAGTTTVVPRDLATTDANEVCALHCGPPSLMLTLGSWYVFPQS
jgi:hypothetical protein